MYQPNEGADLCSFQIQVTNTGGLLTELTPKLLILLHKQAIMLSISFLNSGFVFRYRERTRAGGQNCHIIIKIIENPIFF